MIYEIFFWSVYFLAGILGQVCSEPQNLFHQIISHYIFLSLQEFAAIIIQNHILITLSILCGILVGFTLGLIGGGGSILAVPLLVYLIGLNPHVAIGTSAFAVSVNALINFIDHKKKGHVLFKKSILFAIPGVIGTIIGSQLGLITPSNSLLLFFALFMVMIAIKTLLENRKNKIQDKVNLNSLDEKAVPESNSDNKKNQSTDKFKIDSKRRLIFNQKKNLKFILIGFLVGLGAGYFGIGGGFLIVPSLMYLGINISDAIGTSLLPVSFFGLTTAISYTMDGQIDYFVAILFIIGGIFGGKIGTIVSLRTSKNKLVKIFSIILFAVALYIIVKTIWQ